MKKTLSFPYNYTTLLKDPLHACFHANPCSWWPVPVALQASRGFPPLAHQILDMHTRCVAMCTSDGQPKLGSLEEKTEHRNKVTYVVSRCVQAMLEVIMKRKTCKQSSLRVWPCPAKVSGWQQVKSVLWLNGMYKCLTLQCLRVFK